MIKEPHVPLFSTVTCLSDAMDLVDRDLTNHHKRVAYFAGSLANEIHLPIEERKAVVVAAAMHDAGALSLDERLRTVRFEFENPHHHAEAGYQLLKDFPPFFKAAQVVRYHHVPWNGGTGSNFGGEQVPLGSQILHLADRLDTLIDKDKEILGQADSIDRTIQEHSGTMFVPELVDAFKSRSKREEFWLDALYRETDSILDGGAMYAPVELGLEGLLGLAKVFARIIDFRSPFTATHSRGVAANAATLAKHLGFSERECKLMTVAGYLHDLGKLAVPVEILEKQGKLTDEEFRVIRSHTFYTNKILGTINDLDTVNIWASLHHEKMDGSGYPFHLSGHDMPLGSRIMAVADCFTALTEDRPYRPGMENDKALNVMQGMGDRLALDPFIVSTLAANCDRISAIGQAAQAASAREYDEFRRSPRQ